MLIQPDRDLLTVVGVRAVALEALEHTGHSHGARHHTDPGDPEAHGECAHQPGEEEACRQPDERTHDCDDAQLKRRTPLEYRGFDVQPLGQDFTLIGHASDDARGFGQQVAGEGQHHGPDDPEDADLGPLGLALARLVELRKPEIGDPQEPEYCNG